MAVAISRSRYNGEQVMKDLALLLTIFALPLSVCFWMWQSHKKELLSMLCVRVELIMITGECLPVYVIKDRLIARHYYKKIKVENIDKALRELEKLGKVRMIRESLVSGYSKITQAGEVSKSC